VSIDSLCDSKHEVVPSGEVFIPDTTVGPDRTVGATLGAGSATAQVLHPVGADT